MKEKNRVSRTSKPVLAFVGLLFLATLGYFGYAVVSSNLAQARVADTFLPVAATVISSDVRASSSGSRNAPRVYAFVHGLRGTPVS